MTAHCIYCGRAGERSQMRSESRGAYCERCMRTADAERMRQADAREREPAMPGDPTRLDELGRHLLLRSQVELPATHIDYPRQLVASGARLEAALRSIDLATAASRPSTPYVSCSGWCAGRPASWPTLGASWPRCASSSTTHTTHICGS